MNSEQQNNYQKYYVLIFLMMCLLVLMNGCGTTSQETSDLLILEDELDESVDETQEEITELESGDTEEVYESVEQTTEATVISVYICGAVCNAGVYELEAGSRVYHVLTLAGGMTADAMETYLNQAQELVDGQKIYVPTVQEVEDGIVVVSDASVSDSSASEVEGSSDSGKVNINTASKEELMTLTGIGESKAESIIAYRTENGDFASTEELMNITGIKSGVYDPIEDMIVVD